MGSLRSHSGNALAQEAGRGQARLLVEVACLRCGENHGTLARGGPLEPLDFRKRVCRKSLDVSLLPSLDAVFTLVLGSARTGLIFTGIQEGAQPGQTELGIPYHVPSCWVPVGGELGGGNSLADWERARGPIQENGSVGRVVCVVFSPYLCRCCYCSLCLLFC